MSHCQLEGWKNGRVEEKRGKDGRVEEWKGGRGKNGRMEEKKREEWKSGREERVITEIGRICYA